MDIYCEDCGAYFREDCHCDGIFEVPANRGAEKRWTGIDGHAYIGYEGESTAYASHDTDNCRCPQSPNFDPDSWY